MEVISISNVSKAYKLYDNPLDRVKESIIPFSSRNYHREFFALKNVNLVIKKGETVGIIGKNGSGKSTLLKMISGVLTPSTGSIAVKGRVSALLELGAGFNPEYTGMENIFLNGTIMGFTRDEMKKKLDEILTFADIGDFIHQPVKMYSSGMFARLAFAVAINVEPEILIVDEALSVGDMAFQVKCMNKIKSMMEKGCTTLFVSHDIGAIKTLCNRAVYLENGVIKEVGDSGKVCDQYINDQRAKHEYLRKKDFGSDNIQVAGNKDNFRFEFSEIDRDRFEKAVASTRKGTGEVKIIYSRIVDEDDREINEIEFNQRVTVKVYYETQVEVPEIVAAIHIRDKNQLEIVGTNTKYENVEIKNLPKGSCGEINFTFTNKLRAGNYSLTLLMVDAIPTNTFFDRVDNAVVFKVNDEPNKTRWALVSLPMEVASKIQ
ncbi:ABC transporter ATP-binding protein [Ammoniphilus sp. 3BR4]|uniref:ABC transporter ATP-binding protein n=1 Tax=Ammoniphilus sp. 3BR4 TaxID=3158265 RepID=UPI0034659214